MKLKVSESALGEAAECPHGFSCLTDQSCGKEPLCTVSEADGHNVLFLNEGAPRSCPFRCDFAGMSACTCPVRYAVYLTYKQ